MKINDKFCEMLFNWREGNLLKINKNDEWFEASILPIHQMFKQMGNIPPTSQSILMMANNM